MKCERLRASCSIGGTRGDPFGNVSVTPEEGPIDECNRARARAIVNYG